MSIFGRLKRSIFGDSAETKPGLLADERLAARKTFAQWAGDEAKPNLSAGERLAAQRHQVADDGVVTDTRTGLMWMHCPLGQTWDGTTCIGHAQAFSWGQAMALRHSFAGYDDWRLPSIDELKSIVDKPTDFPRSIGGSTYWSSSPDPSSSKRSPFSMRENGSECRDYPERAYRVRLVRGSQFLGAVKNNATPSTAQALPAFTQVEAHKDVPSNIMDSPIREEVSGNFIVRNNGTVMDTRTGLMWMRCALGQTWDGTTCIEQPQTFTWDQAMALRHSFAGYDDWRLSDIDELKSISTVSTSVTAIFPDRLAQPNVIFWTCSLDDNYSKSCMSFDFREGRAYRDYPERNFRVRLVRDIQSLGAEKNNATTFTAPELPASIQVESHGDVSTHIMDSPIREEASGNFIIRSDSTVTDTLTGLMWMRCALGQTWDGTICVGDGKAQKYTWNEAMTLRHSFAGYDDWRLPSIDELKSVFVAFDTKVFPDRLVNPIPEFWSNSLDANNKHWPLSISVGFGGTFRGYPERSYRVRLVRNGQISGVLNVDKVIAELGSLDYPFLHEVILGDSEMNRSATGDALHLASLLASSHDADPNFVISGSDGEGSKRLSQDVHAASVFAEQCNKAKHWTPKQRLLVRQRAETLVHALRNYISVVANQSNDRKTREHGLQDARYVLTVLKRFPVKFHFLHLDNLQEVEDSIVAVEAETRSLYFRHSAHMTRLPASRMQTRLFSFGYAAVRMTCNIVVRTDDMVADSGAPVSTGEADEFFTKPASNCATTDFHIPHLSEWGGAAKRAPKGQSVTIAEVPDVEDDGGHNILGVDKRESTHPINKRLERELELAKLNHGSASIEDVNPTHLSELHGAAKWAEGLNDLKHSVIQGSMITLSFRELFLKLNWKARPHNKYNISELVRLLESSDIGLEPDINYAKPPKPDGMVVLFAQPLDSESSRTTPAYQLALLTLELSSAVAIADGDFCDVEKNHLREQILSWSHLTSSHQQRLLAHLELLKSAPASLANLKKKLGQLDVSARESIAEFMATVAQVDGVVLPAEVKILEKIYKALGLDPNKVFSDLHVFATEGKPTSAEVKKIEETGFTLDPARIIALQRDTEKGFALLTAIFKEEESIVLPVQKPDADIPDAEALHSILGLDKAHAILARKLLSRPQWCREELLAMAADLELMLDGALELINEASFDIYGIAFAEGDDPFVINPEVLEQIEL